MAALAHRTRPSTTSLLLPPPTVCAWRARSPSASLDTRAGHWCATVLAAREHLAEMYLESRLPQEGRSPGQIFTCCQKRIAARFESTGGHTDQFVIPNSASRAAVDSPGSDY